MTVKFQVYGMVADSSCFSPVAVFADLLTLISSIYFFLMIAVIGFMQGLISLVGLCHRSSVGSTIIPLVFRGRFLIFPGLIG